MLPGHNWMFTQGTRWNRSTVCKGINILIEMLCREAGQHAPTGQHAPAGQHAPIGQHAPTGQWVHDRGLRSRRCRHWDSWGSLSWVAVHARCRCQWGATGTPRGPLSLSWVAVHDRCRRFVPNPNNPRGCDAFGSHFKRSGYR